MIGTGAGARVMVATRPVDFRKGADSLAELVGVEYGGDPFSGVIYVFRATRSDRIILVWWDGTGLCLMAKKFEQENFKWPGIRDGVMRLRRGPETHSWRYRAQRGQLCLSWRCSFLYANHNTHSLEGKCERGHPCHHVRRKIYELAGSSPVATEVLRRIALLYAVEDEVRGHLDEHRRSVRAERSRAIIDDLQQFLDARGRQVSAKSKLGEAIRYALNRWDGLTRFIDEGCNESRPHTLLAWMKTVEPSSTLGPSPSTRMKFGNPRAGQNKASLPDFLANKPIDDDTVRTRAVMQTEYAGQTIPLIAPQTGVLRRTQIVSNVSRLPNNRTRCCIFMFAR